jgi:type I restriction-modification system DNA methylase subunit
MTDQDILVKRKIESTLKSFSSGSISQSSLALFAALGYNTTRQNPFDKKTAAEFEDNFGHAFVEKNFNKEKAGFSEWKTVDLLFQLSREELSGQQGLFDSHKINWEGEDEKTVIETYLFFAIELTKPEYSRTLLAQITREVNKIFPMPVMIIFRHGQNLTLSIIDRRLHKRDAQKDVLKKVTLIKDISIESPHRAHLEILFDLSLDELRRVHKFTNFVELHNAWQKTLDTKELNKRFYSELSNWYFWAMDHVSFPDDVEKNKDIRNATSLIRLITRIIFVWFIKEKSLVPDALFDRRGMQNILKVFYKNKKSDSYYRAILQNLFFGTLNQTMNERGFAKEGTFLENKNNYGVKNLFRYAGDFSVDEKEALALFKDIPFLNGGLFDCLDKENDQDKVVYGDGFSRNPKKQAIVPDFLFFGAEEEYDLNAIFGTKNKRYKVKGLFNILSAYKFTVAENTPVEEEVALDPELLGRVFENLLASYNPETQTTARKQTGSFYTPREIVNYMVDESLKAYLQQKLEIAAGMEPEDANAGLEILFSYTEKEHAFTGRETKTLITAIDDCKILDPACGSGAFPMGVLHKLVHILHKLDPHNEKWKERQISKARQIDDPAIREQSIANIESAFANNELDYGRKLYLIENCIYGIDIQPIAVQIAKLRFFISLVVDQRKQPSKKNIGILSLPNLETKFVAANTLIGLDKPQLGGQISLKNPEIENLENDLKALRHQYFNARTRKEKLACQKKDRDLRKKISVLLIKDGWASASAKQVASFDPYDQNVSSPFFDPEWMFGIMEGFNVVMGNPPYIFTRDADFTDNFKKYIDKKYFSILATKDKKSKANQSGKINLFALFILRGLFECQRKGTLMYIVPNNLLRTTTYDLVRKYLLEHSKINEIVDLGSGVFDNVTASTILFRISNEKEISNNLTKIVKDIKDIEKHEYSITFIKQSQFLENVSYTFNFFADSSTNHLLNKISEEKNDLGIFCVDIIEGIVAHKHLISESKIKNSFPLVEGKTIKKYGLHPLKKFITWKTEEIHRTRPDYLWNAPKKIIIQRISGGSNPLVATLDLDGYKTFASVNNLLLKDKYVSQYELILALINSKVINWYYANSFSNNSELTVNISKTFLEKLPIVNFDADKNKSIKKIVVYVLHLIKQNQDSTFFERLIDAMVYELYFPDEIKAADAEVLKHLTALPEIKDEWTDEKKLAVIEKVYKELSDSTHPASIAMAKQKNVPAVRIIEGLDQ